MWQQQLHSKCQSTEEKLVKCHIRDYRTRRKSATGALFPTEPTEEVMDGVTFLDGQLLDCLARLAGL